MDAEFGALDDLHHQSGQAGLHRQVLLARSAKPASTSRPSTSAAKRPGGNAVALIEIDGELPPPVLAKVRALPQVQQAKLLRF